MDTNQILDDLWRIALYKEMLPMNLRGWVNALDLHVQQRRAGNLTRLQAGGKFKSYFDAWEEEGGDWEIKKFDSETWEERFADVLQPTVQIAEYLFAFEGDDGSLDSHRKKTLSEAVELYKITGEWDGLPRMIGGTEYPPEQDLDEAILLDPQLADAYHTRGAAYSNLDQYERAIQDYDDAIRLDPQYALAYYTRGLVYEELGKSTEAELDIAKAKELGYDP